MTRRPVRSSASRLVPRTYTLQAASSAATPASSTTTTPMSSAYPSTYNSEVEGRRRGRQDFSRLPHPRHSARAPPPRPPRARKALPLPVFCPRSSASRSTNTSSRTRTRSSTCRRTTTSESTSTSGSCASAARSAQRPPTSSTARAPSASSPPIRAVTSKSKRPLLARLKPGQRECITTLELRLGPGWNAPPKGWVVNDALGLKDCVNVRKLSVFVECDPSDGVFKGFRRSEGFYEGFSRKLLASVAETLPHLAVIEFDSWSSVKKSGAMMQGLLDVAAQTGRLIRWGPSAAGQMPTKTRSRPSWTPTRTRQHCT
ncbi:hypothetical protein ACCO45_006374 [Purpureocillium lilacinum]|uniref:Uncharacterized protein n=1 Tax=Purpureocillium lilacinum TaxID=33203 RepID=A0ACC4DQ52_PURLI